MTNPTQTNSDTSHKWLSWAHEILGIAQSGLTYTENQFERERFEWLQDLGHRIMAEYNDVSLETVKEFFTAEKGYATPKVDVRAAVFFKNEILMVKEKVDGKWSLPGGWADINLSPSEAAVKEVFEESGFEVVPTRLLAVFDRRRHGHPPGPFFLYKIIFQCEIIGGKPTAGTETLDVDFFPKYELPELSEGRITQSQIFKLFEFLDDVNKPAVFD